MLKMSEPFGHSSVDELVERNTFLLREVFRYSTHGGDKPEGKLADNGFFLTRGH
jgi:hypothetical protein